MELIEIGKRAKAVSPALSKLLTDKKNEVLIACADALEAHAEEIVSANAVDMENGRAKGMPPSLQDRLLLTKERVRGMANGLRDIAKLDDPIGEVLGMKKRPNGLLIGQKRVPLGVVGVIYEARPNVTSDVFGLCFKTGNATILRGGSDSIKSNLAITKVLRDTLESQGVPVDALQLISDTTHESVNRFMKMKEYVDVLIPRGGNRLIQNVVNNSTIPAIETGTGNCHIFVDSSADLDMALKILINAKTQRIGVCNACESLVVHKDVAEEFLPRAAAALAEYNVEIRADEAALPLMPGSVPATEEDYGTEYLDYIISVKVVDSAEAAIAHINKYNTGHSESIVTKDYDNAQRFLDEIDAACVYVNASTRFTDGGEFGFGGEIGISTQKLHARGPMGLIALTTTKYIIYGDGQIR